MNNKDKIIATYILDKMLQSSCDANGALQWQKQEIEKRSVEEDAKIDYKAELLEYIQSDVDYTFKLQEELFELQRYLTGQKED